MFKTGKLHLVATVVGSASLVITAIAPSLAASTETSALQVGPGALDNLVLDLHATLTGHETCDITETAHQFDGCDLLLGNAGGVQHYTATWSMTVDASIPFTSTDNLASSVANSPGRLDESNVSITGSGTSTNSAGNDCPDDKPVSGSESMVQTSTTIGHAVNYDSLDATVDGDELTDFTAGITLPLGETVTTTGNNTCDGSTYTQQLASDFSSYGMGFSSPGSPPLDTNENPIYTGWSLDPTGTWATTGTGPIATKSVDYSYVQPETDTPWEAASGTVAEQLTIESHCSGSSTLAEARHSAEPAADAAPTCWKVQLSVVHPDITLMGHEKIEATIVNTSCGCSISHKGASFDFAWERSSGAGGWTELRPAAAKPSYQWDPLIAGTFTVRVTAVLKGTSQQVSKPLTVKFPTIEQIEANSGVAIQDQLLWEEGRGDAEATPVQPLIERCWWWSLDTSNGRYEHGDVITGTSTGCPQGDVRPPDSAEVPPLDDAPIYVVAFFHAHPARIPKLVGPSTADERESRKNMTPGIVIDYIANSRDGNSIVKGSALNSPTKTYSYGPDRRPTPGS